MLDFESGNVMQVLQDAADLAEDFAGLVDVHAGLRRGSGHQQSSQK